MKTDNRCSQCRHFLKVKWTGSVCVIKDYMKVRGNCKACENFIKVRD